MQKRTEIQWDIGAALGTDDGADESTSPQAGISGGGSSFDFKMILAPCRISRCASENEESSCFSSEVDPPLGGHNVETGSMLALRCKFGEIGLSRVVHFAESVLVIHG